jgi:hypothetical protein
LFSWAKEKIEIFWRNWELRHFKRLWTSERDRWFLVEVELRYESGNRTGYAIGSDEGHRLIIEDDSMYRYVVDQMKKAGVRLYTLDELGEETPRNV